MRSTLTSRFAALAALLVLACADRAWAQVDESDLKAAFIFNFAAFTTWPDGAAGADLAVCTQRQLQPSLQRALRNIAGKSVQGRIVRLVALGAVRDVGACHVLVIGVDGLVADPALRAALAGKSVLTVCDCAPDAGGGEIIHLVHDGHQLGFSIDRPAADAARLLISSKLLRLARSAP